LGLYEAIAAETYPWKGVSAPWLMVFDVGASVYLGDLR
jgi:hypothetical protein